MPPKRIEFTVPGEFLKRIDKARGYEPRASFVKRALESALRSEATAEPDSQDRASRTETVIPSASSRAPQKFDHVNVAQNPDGSLRVKTHQELAMERQAKLNKDKS